MSKKSGKISRLVEKHHGQKLDAHYLGYFDCFNRQQFYEAHEVLEYVWLKDRRGPNGAFYKGLIQLAGAFVHLQRDHLRPAAALFKLAQANLEKYPPHHEHLDAAATLRLISDWLSRLENSDFQVNPLTASNHPQIHPAA